jgi:hypothetical protein
VVGAKTVRPGRNFRDRVRFRSITWTACHTELHPLDGNRSARSTCPSPSRTEREPNRVTS